MTSPMEQANQSKRQSRGWSDEMDSQAISRRLAIVEELHAAWTVLKNVQTTIPQSGTSGAIPAKSDIPSDNRLQVPSLGDPRPGHDSGTG